MSKIEIYSPYLSILHASLPGTLEAISNAGFDGIECHLIGNLLREKPLAQVIDVANEQNLKIRFHQGWSWVTGQRIWQNWVLRVCGALVPSSHTFEEQTKLVDEYPVVMYGNVARTTRKSNYLFQSIAEFKSRKEAGYASSLQEFMDDVVAYNLPVVFDIQHILEWYYDVENVTGLPADSYKLIDTAVMLWHRLKQYVKEIHLCDFDPRLSPSSGRNLNLGRGIFPLHEFAEEVQYWGWSGIVTPEVQPAFLKEKGDLVSLCCDTRNLRNLFG